VGTTPSQKWGVYFFPERDKENPNIKIGYSKHPLKRLAQLQTGSSDRIGSEGWFVVNTEADAIKLEAMMHSVFSKERIRQNGEWFKFSAKMKKYLELNYRNPVFFRYYN
jgi:hypothetical protein